MVEDRCNSIRWVTAQWKHEPVHKDYGQTMPKGWGPSPYLAQRFDDGVLHVTVQDEHCRCAVASAIPHGMAQLHWEKDKPLECLSTHPKDSGQEVSCKPQLKVEYVDGPLLDNALGSWVDMEYRVQAGDPARIEVHQGGKHIVTVTSRIGYRMPESEPSMVKFKIGQYRNYMPFVHTMDVDRVEIEPAP